MGKVKRYVLRVKGKMFFNKQCVETLRKVCVPRMTSIRKDIYKNRKHISWRDDLDYLWKYYKKYIADGNCDLRMYHEHRKGTYASSLFKQTASIQGYRTAARVNVARGIVPIPNTRWFRRPGETAYVPVDPPRPRVTTAVVDVEDYAIPTPGLYTYIPRIDFERTPETPPPAARWARLDLETLAFADEIPGPGME